MKSESKPQAPRTKVAGRISPMPGGRVVHHDKGLTVRIDAAPFNEAAIQKRKAAIRAILEEAVAAIDAGELDDNPSK